MRDEHKRDQQRWSGGSNGARTDDMSLWAADTARGVLENAACTPDGPARGPAGTKRLASEPGELFKRYGLDLSGAMLGAGIYWVCVESGYEGAVKDSEERIENDERREVVV